MGFSINPCQLLNNPYSELRFTFVKEQIKEFKRRDKKAIKMWDSAEERLQKKLDKEKERIRQEEIAELESKLKKLQNGD